jgi:hypothetical protein
MHRRLARHVADLRGVLSLCAGMLSFGAVVRR